MSNAKGNAVKELLKSDLFFKTTTKSTFDGILVIELDVFVYANKIICDILGFSKKELLNVTFEQFVPEKYHKEMYMRIAKGVQGTFQAEVITKKRGIIKIEYNSNIVNFQGTNYRILVIKEIEPSVETNNYWENIINNSSETIGVVDTNFKLLSINKVPDVAETLGFTKENIIGLDIFSTVAKTQHQMIKDRVKLIKETRKSTSFIVEGNAGSMMQNTYIPIFEEDKYTGFIAISYDVTSDLRENNLLKESEAKYKNLIEYAPEVILVMDLETMKFVEVSRQASRFFGYTKAEMLELGVLDISAEFDDEGFNQHELIKRELAFFYDGEKLQNGETISIDVIHLDKRGNRIPSETRLIMLPDKNKRLLRASIYDISERKELETLIAKLSQELSRKTGDEFLNETNTLLANALNADYTFIGLLDETKESITTIAHCKKGVIIKNITYEISNTPCANVLTNEVCTYSKNITTLFPQDKMLTDTQIEAYVGIPLTNSKNEVIGLVAVLFKEQIENSKHVESIIQLFSNRIATEIERSKSEMSLIESEEKFRSIFENSENIILLINKNGMILDVNKADKGFKKSDIIGSLIFDWINIKAEKMEVIRAVDNAFNKGIHGKFKTTIVNPSTKENNYYYATINPLNIDAKNNVAIISTVDVTEQKNYELFLRKALNEVSDLKSQLERENTYLKEEVQLTNNFNNIIYKSEKFKEVLSKVEQVAGTDSTVLILGETGTGKELIARAIHATSNRKDKTLVKLNCAVLSKDLIESELFGHEKGAFTGALNKKLGKFELANKGTIFLDEIGELSLDLQVKLLRVLQEGEIDRVGGSETIKVDVRIIAATNKSLKEEVALGKFRSDLFYRLNVFPLLLPTLRERREDISLLASHFLEKYSEKMKKKDLVLSEGSIARMRTYNWPGNVRELENVIERAVVRSTGKKLIIENLLDEFNEIEAIDLEEKLSLNETLKEIEKNHIIDILDNTNWKIQGEKGAAIKLNIAPSTLRDKMKKFGIERTNSN